MGAANVPIIHYAVRLWGGQHPKVVTKGGGGLSDPNMQMAFGMGMLAFTLIAIVLCWKRAKVHMAQAKIDGLEQEAIQLGLVGE